MEQIKVLIVNDEPMALLILETILAQVGIQQSNIYKASNGKESVEKAETINFELVLMDLNMPVMGGFEATQKIRLIAKSTHIVALSASTID